MHNPNATTTAKIPMDESKESWAEDRQSTLMRLHEEACYGHTGNSAVSPTIVKSGSTGYDGSTDPGPAGEPV